MGKIPKIDSIEELAKFWDAHDVTDFEDELEEVREPVSDRGAAEPFTWDHAGVRTSVGDLVDGNVDSLIENPVVPTGVKPAPYWGPAESLPKDRRLFRDRLFGPEWDGIELDEREITAWKASLDKAILEGPSRTA
jgi:hypothetical protein